MPFVDLIRDPRTRFFAAPAVVPRRDLDGRSANSVDAFVNLEFFIDTGSNRTCIAEGIAERLGADLRHVERVPAAGIGGFASQPILKDFTFWLKTNDAGMFQVRLPQVTVVEDRDERVSRNRGGFTRSVRRRLPGVSLLGLDLLEVLRATLTVRAHEDFARIEWG